jgi:NAD(P)-dependent dehydrogenase (short-subunit alcohol dehydrogenase family)
MMTDLRGQVALVTGATRGIGKGIAIGLGEAGATVYITGRSVAPDSAAQPANIPGTLNETQAEVEAAGGVCIPVKTDHADDEQVQALFQRIELEQQGQLDLLVNNAFGGVNVLKEAYGKPFWELDADLWDKTNHVGLRSHYVASIYAARLMTPRRRGLITTISSWGGLSYIFGVAYGAGKAACDRMAADMAVELKPHDVASISIWPGIVGTELLSQFFQQEAADADEDARASALRSGYNWETPLLTGRAIAALAASGKAMKRTGQVQIVAELAKEFDLVDKDGNRPASLRSLRFALPFAVPGLRDYAQWVPDVEVPWPLLLVGALGSPKT